MWIKTEPMRMAVLFFSTWACFACSFFEEDKSEPSQKTEHKQTLPLYPVSQEVCASSEKIEDTIALRQKVAEKVSWKDDSYGADSQQLSKVKILGFNDFHGQLSVNKRVEGRPVGGAAELASFFKTVMKGVEAKTVIVHAGDLIGASPPESALHHDVPTVAFVNALANKECEPPEQPFSSCNVLAGLGNHELDNGVDALMDLLEGKGGDDGGKGKGVILREKARFPMISANVVDMQTGEPFLPPYVIRKINDVAIGFVGAMLRYADIYLMPSGIRSIRFEDEVTSIQSAVDTLKNKGIRTIVLVLHQGGAQKWNRSQPGDAPIKGPIVDIVSRIDQEIDLVVTGHSHSPMNILMPNRDGRPTLVTQGFVAGTGFADIDLVVDRKTGDVVEKSARIITTWADEGPGLTPDADIAAMVTRAVEAVKEKTNTPFNQTTKPFPKMANCDGDSAIGSLIADAQRAALNTDFAFIQPSWIRADLPKGTVTWGDLFAVQPFGNQVVRLEMTGQEVFDLLNQQWLDDTHQRVFNVSGLTFSWDPQKPKTDRIVEVRVQGKPLNLLSKYTVAVNEFLAQGGEKYSEFKKAKRLSVTVSDIEAFAVYVKKLPSPMTPIIEGRVRRVRH